MLSRKIRMSEIDDGVIKYDTSGFTLSSPLGQHEYEDLEKWRHQLYQLKLIGEYLPEKIGYGNLSLKKDYSNFHQTNHSQFVITGTQTGGREHLDGKYYTRVLDYNFKNWSIKAMGPLQASSEALTHAAIYEADSQNIKCVFHIHNKEIWKGMIDQQYDSTPEDVPYGTEEMAKAVQSSIGNKTSGIIVMKGHEDGVISYGKTMQEAADLILEVHTKFCK